MHMRRGFTLVELLIAVAIIAILTYLAATSFLHAREQARLSTLATDEDTIAKTVNQYVEDNNYQYPPDVSRGVPPGLQPYLQGGVWPAGPWPNGSFDWDNWPYTYHGQTTPSGVPSQYRPYLGEQVVEINYHLCPVGDPNPTTDCEDPGLFPSTFMADSGIYYCFQGPCIPHQDEPDIEGYCVNCKPPEYGY
jgi:prepilin-type N-terminal cleavage/methylation domain-containing protein